VVNAGKEPVPGFLIEWFHQRVDEAIAKHGTGQAGQGSPRVARLPENYRNPRHLSEDWIRRFLGRSKDELAVDAILAFDEVDTLRKKLDRANLKIWIMSLIVSPLVGEVVKLLAARLLFHIWLK